MTRGGVCTIYKNFNFLALTVWARKQFEDLEEKDDSLDQLFNEIMSEEGVCRTAPTTPGLLNIVCLVASRSSMKFTFFAYVFLNNDMRRDIQF